MMRVSPGLFEMKSPVNKLLFSLALSLCASVLLVSMVKAQSIKNKIEENVHLGSATCATSQCHGKSEPVAGRNVHLDEYTFWIDQDYHATAYKTLLSDESKSMAAKLGLKSARTAKICLDCHTDNVPSDKKGAKFQISDGVGCEACHGGAEKWIKTHTDPSATHAENVAAGLIATEVGSVRAELCLSCHLGTKDKYATHQIMGAGHPRLRFEMNLFSENQPAHYSIDDDYIERKGFTPGFNLWLEGQFISAIQGLEVAIARMHDSVGIFPDLAFYDCDSCHHSTNNLRWSSTRADGLQPGTLRLQMPNVALLLAYARATGSDAIADQLQSAKRQVLHSAQGSKDGFKNSANAMLGLIRQLREQSKRDFSNAEVSAVRLAILQAAGSDRASDFAEAEQVIYSFESLCIVLKEIDKCAPELDKLFDGVKRFNDFNPTKFARIAKSVSSNL